MMRAIESSHADRQLVCRTRSQRVIKPKMDTDYNYDYQAQSGSSAKATRPYDLNKMKSLQKKQEACSRCMFTSQERANGRLRLTLSTAAYEVFRATVDKLYSSNSIHHEFRDFYAKHKSNTDRSGTAVVDENYRIFNRLKNGNCGQRLKFTINMYHTTSTVLINGSQALSIFDDIHLPIIISYMSPDQIQNADRKFQEALTELVNNPKPDSPLHH